MKKRHWQRRLISTCLIGLIFCFLSGCSTITPTIPENQQPPMPAQPEKNKVTFEPRPGGLFLSFEEYRQLEENIIELRRYIAELEAQLAFYTGRTIDE